MAAKFTLIISDVQKNTSSIFETVQLIRFWETIKNWAVAKESSVLVSDKKGVSEFLVICDLTESNLGQEKKKKKKNYGDKKIFHLGSGNFFLINLIESFKKVYIWRTTLTALFFVEKQRVNCSNRKKRQFVWMNLLVENRLNGKFYWLNDWRMNG